ncbi:YaeQ family protein [Rivibacter subsaxonicus]|uniref:Uncharacterized protein YaeQ n=1 Tax=Rivibacter subsaxonicus TaxID=457575 RepID=A0A4Q7VFY5_9BURK|nr:YaeQ family protein [Rivibacter subsaxonicus]RZT94907.1 uncharacterized protein YaeQ [Rivibacter subsaxonicus]
MALKSTIYKADLQIADMDRPHYGDHALTLAQHPSENEERLMMRLLAYALHASEAEQRPLQFARGMTEMDEPDLWRRSYTDEIELWIDVGQPEEKWLRKASHRAQEQLLYVYGRTGGLWWQQNRATLEKLPGLRVRRIDADASAALVGLAERSMRLNCTVQDGHVWIGNDRQTVDFVPEDLKLAQPR